MTVKKFKLVIWTITLIVVVASCIIRFTPFAYDVSETAEYDFNGHNISEIDVDVDVADLYIEYGSEFKVNTNYQKIIEPKVTLNDGKLEIKQNNSVNVRYIDDCYIKIVLPEQITVDTADIVASAGDIDIEGVSFGSLKIDADAGDIDINEAHGNSLDIEAGAGDVDVTKSDFEKVKVTTDLGSVKLEDVSGVSGTFTADMGSIDVQGDFEKITASCELGDIDITVPNADKVDFDLDCELGSINVNGSSWKK